MKPMNEDEEIRILGGSNWKGTSGEDKSPKEKVTPGGHRSHKKLGVGILVAFFVLLLVGGLIYRDHRVYGFEYPQSRLEGDVIESLQQPRPGVAAGIEKMEDTILGVPMRLYKISGLEPEFCKGVPALDDADVYLVTRSSDYRYKKDKPVLIGDYILNGEELCRNSWRAGYFVVVDGHVEIGIGHRPKMRNYVLENKGCMFRQFALVSAGIKCVSQYVLKGKVSRCAYARMANNDLYYVESVEPETLFGFADALIEYGFVDAIYVTGGSQPGLFYRDAQGVRHGDYVDDKQHRMVVWKKRK